LIQQGPIGSVWECLGRRFPGRSANFKLTSLLKKRVSSIWLRVVGPMASFAHDADAGRPTNWSVADDDSVLAAGIKFR